MRKVVKGAMLFYVFRLYARISTIEKIHGQSGWQEAG
jgi:hypothetical protein